MTKKDNANKSEGKLRTEEFDTFDQLIEILYESELSALRMASDLNYTEAHRNRCKGHADGCMFARKRLQALRDDSYVIGC